MITIKRIPTEPETYEVWLIPESVGFDSSFGVRGAVRSTAEDLPGERAKAELEEANRALAEAGAPLSAPLIARVHWLASDRVQLRHSLDVVKEALANFRVAVDDVGAALTEAGMSDHGTPAERVRRMAEERTTAWRTLEAERRQRQEVEAKRDRFFREATGLRERLSAADAERNRLLAAFDAAAEELARVRTGACGAPDAAALRIQADIEKAAWPPK